MTRSLSGFALTGAANMTLRANGAKQTYSGLTDGEKLRVKIATAIALIQHGYVGRIGRHPGLLVLDAGHRLRWRPAGRNGGRRRPRS